MSTKSITAPAPASLVAELWRPSPQASTSFAMLLVDFLTLSLVFAFAAYIRHAVTPAYLPASRWEFFTCIAALLVGFGFQGLYPGVLLHPADEMRRIFVSVTVVFLLMACSSFLSRNLETYSRSVFLITWALGSPCVMFARRLSRRYLSRCPWWGIPAIILGSGPAAARVLKSLGDGRRGVKVVGILSDFPDTPSADLPAPILGPISSARDIAKLKGISIAIVTSPITSETDNRHTIRDYCRGFRHIVLVPDIPGLCSLGVSVREIGGELGLEMPQRLFHASSAFSKRFLDIALSGLALLLLSPLYLTLALAVRLTSPGPVFFRQKRYGRSGDSFFALKFRTMVQNAEEVLADRLSERPELLAEWARDQKLRSDPRMTPIGKWMRRLSLDELPQLWNVFRGEMSLIGPRPIVKTEIEKYGPAFDLYSRVRPGMTGLWQVSGRNRTTYAQRVALDEFYVNNWSVWLDLYILSRTLQVVVTADGAY